jgi:hypothetical protein
MFFGSLPNETIEARIDAGEYPKAKIMRPKKGKSVNYAGVTVNLSRISHARKPDPFVSA